MEVQRLAINQLTVDAEPVGYPKINSELSELAQCLGAELQGHFGISYFSHPRIDARYRGYRCRVFGMNHDWSGPNGSSVSCIVELPRHIRHRLRLQNREIVRTTAWFNLEFDEREARTDLDKEALQRVLPDPLRTQLQKAEFDYLLTVNFDRVTFTVFNVYGHRFYLNILDLLTEMATQLQELE